MPMSVRERILAVYKNETPDCVPYMLDLSHWFYHTNRIPWDLSRAFEAPEYDLLDYHKRAGVGFYMPNLASFYSVEHGSNVQATVTRSPDGREITWRYETPLGVITRSRRWSEQTYAWAIAEWGVHSEQDLKVLGYALGNRSYSPRWDRYRAWGDYVGDCGVVYMPFGYSAMGQLLNYWMGVAGTVYASVDLNETMHDVVDRINANGLDCIDLLVQSPADVIVMGDNFSSDIQPPAFFNEWSRPFYVEAFRRIHDAGKYVAVHIDGRLRGALEMFTDLGADCADAVTPAPMGDLDPEQCRAEARSGMILSGGVPPNVWLPQTDVAEFKAAVRQWLALKKYGPRFIANAGDQVPPGADEDRIAIMHDLVDRHGKY